MYNCHISLKFLCSKIEQGASQLAGSCHANFSLYQLQQHRIIATILAKMLWPSSGQKYRNYNNTSLDAYKRAHNQRVSKIASLHSCHWWVMSFYI